MAQHQLGVHARPAFQIAGNFFALEVGNVLDVRLGDKDMRRAVGDANDIHFPVDMIAIFQHGTKRRRTTRRLENNCPIFAPLMPWMLAVWNSLDRSQIDVQAFLFKEAFVMGDPHRRDVHRQSRPKHNDL
ncbi:MAG: hypothetical protein HW419_3405, partial [Deltaproteobacteria bacterium]|nr:hypothetical protein [Deltaproteobacteria bacterium]